MSRDRCLASEATRLVLDRIGLRTYLFGVRLDARECVVELEHPKEGRWRYAVLRASSRELIASLDDPSRRDAIARAWSADLARANAA
ncbi:MAG TPA: hypothetical protein VIL20_00950 [Sandaracinaceae bacterium]